MIWPEIADEYYASLPDATQNQIDQRVRELLEDPHGSNRGDYDLRSDQWTTVYGAGAGLLVYALVEVNRTLLVLGLV